MKTMFTCDKCGATSSIIAPPNEHYKCPVCGEGRLVAIYANPQEIRKVEFLMHMAGDEYEPGKVSVN